MAVRKLTGAIAEVFPPLHTLAQTPRVIRTLLSDASRQDLDWRPSPERWSISMVLAHLADVEITGFRSRFIAMSEQDGAFLPSYDQLALFESKSGFDALAELAALEKNRADTLAWLESLPPSVLDRRGHHEELGAPVTFAELLHEFVFHDFGHIRQILELYRSHAFYPRMGIFQSYYKVNP